MARPPLSREQTTQATRKALIAAGLASFERDGLDASLDAICARAKLTRGAFYVHFADRDAFVVAVMQDVIGGFVASLALLRGSGSGGGGIARIIKLYIAAVEAKLPAVTGGSGLRLQHLLEACRRSRTIGGAYRELLLTARDRLAEAIAVDQAAAAVRQDIDARSLADLMIVSALGFAARHEVEVPIDVARTAKTLLALIQ